MGASLLLAINVALGVAIMVSFLAFGLFDRNQKPALWWFGACVAGVASGLIEYSMPSVEYTAIARLAIFTCFAICLACVSIGLWLRYLRRIPVVPITIVLVVAIVSYILISELPRSSLLRAFIYQGSYSAIALVGVFAVWKGMDRSALDRTLFSVLLIFALNFLMKPPIMVLLGGNGGVAQDYLSTDYAMVSQTMMAIVTILTAFALGLRTMADILGTIQKRSDIDRLSGALTRDAFHREVSRSLWQSDRERTPKALILCDLDHFKSVNDTFGHQVGDLVIAQFGALLESFRRPGDVVGRIGGEEFCVLLPRCDEGTARLFAEQLRSTFETLDATGGRSVHRCTASFGVTEMRPGEAFETAFSRADKALYEAKSAGRNCVRSARPDIDGQDAAAQNAIEQHEVPKRRSFAVGGRMRR